MNDEYQAWKDEQTVEESIRDNWNAAELDKQWRDKLASLQPPTGGHACRFSGHKRVSPAGGNRHNISVIVSECRCGKYHAKYPAMLTYWERRWINRLNERSAMANA